MAVAFCRDWLPRGPAAADLPAQHPGAARRSRLGAVRGVGRDVRRPSRPSGPRRRAVLPQGGWKRVRGLTGGQNGLEKARKRRGDPGSIVNRRSRFAVRKTDWRTGDISQSRSFPWEASTRRCNRMSLLNSELEIRATSVKSSTSLIGLPSFGHDARPPCSATAARMVRSSNWKLPIVEPGRP